MSDEKQKRTRKANPFTTWTKAKAAADKARRNAARTEKLAAEALEAKANAEAARDELVKALDVEAAAYTALQEALKEDDE